MRVSRLAWLTAILPAAIAGPHAMPYPQEPSALVSSARGIIVSSGLVPFCSSLLGYTAPTITVTKTTTSTISVATSSTYTFISSTIGTQYYAQKSIDYVTRATVAKRAAVPTPTALTGFSGSILTSACKLAAREVTRTTTSTSIVDISYVSTITTTIDVYAYSPTATYTVTSTIDCGLRAVENQHDAEPAIGEEGHPYPGIENCTWTQAHSYVAEDSQDFPAFAIGKRANGLTYCDLLTDNVQNTVQRANGDPNYPFYYYDYGCQTQSPNDPY